MPILMLCPHGHQWESGAEVSVSPAACPHCGAAGTPSPGRTATLAPTVNSAPEAPELPKTLATVAAAPPAERPDIPGYDLLDVLGRGGMGIVYKARQIALKRVVALKMVLGGRADPQALARFRIEAEAVARLQHPNIVQVYEVGAYEGRPFCALEFVEGGSLDRLLAGTPLPARQAAALAETMARAMHAAHEQGVIHRDLKPANILLASREPKVQSREPAGESSGSRLSTLDSGLSALPFRLSTLDSGLSALPKITDFGLAKQLDQDSGFTRSGAVMGTPSYMAPEQAEGRLRDIGPVTDVYGLGAILYEMIAGRPPFRGTTILDTLEQVRSQEPVPPRRLQPKVPRDLETICLKCLRKDLPQRYGSALDLADDLRRFLDDEPIQARPASPAERTWKWAKRHPAPAALILLTALVAIAGFTFITLAWSEAETEGGRARRAQDIADQRARAEREALELAGQARAQAIWQAGQTRTARDQALASIYLNRINLADSEWWADHLSRAEELLDRCPPQLCRWEWHYLKRRFQSEELRLPGGRGVAFRPGTAELTTVDRTGAVTVWDAATGAARHTLLRDPTPRAQHVCYSPDGKLVGVTFINRTVTVWDAATNQVVSRLDGFAAGVVAAGFNTAGDRLATRSIEGDVSVREVKTGREVFRCQGAPTQYTAVAFSPDGTLLATPGVDHTISIRDAASGKEQVSLKAGGNVFHLAFSPDGKHLAAAGHATVTVFELATQKPTRFASHSTWVMCVGFSPDGKRLAAAGWNGVVRIWDFPSGQNTLIFRGHTQPVFALSFSSDGRRLASSSPDASTRIWNATSPPEARTLTGHTGQVSEVAFRPDGKRLASACADNTLKVWDVATGRELLTLKGHDHMVYSVAYSPDGKRLVSVAEDLTIKTWDAEAGTVLWSRALGTEEDGPRNAVFSPDGKRVAGATRTKLVKVWDAGTGEELFTLPDSGRYVAYSPDGKYLASVGHDVPLPTTSGLYAVQIAEANTGRPVRKLQGFDSSVMSIAFSHDSKRLVAAGGDWSQLDEVRVWDVATGQPTLRTRGHGRQIFKVAYSPDDRYIASAGEDGIVKLWDAGTGRECVSLRGHLRGVLGVAFSPDGNLLASASADHTIKLWDGSPVIATRALYGHTGLSRVAVSPDRTRLAVCGSDGTVLIWETTTYQEKHRLRSHARRCRGVMFSPDSRRLVSGGEDGDVRIWDTVTGRELHTLRGHSGHILSVAYSPDGKHVASAGSDKSVRLWSAETGAEVRRFTGHSAYVMSVTFSPDGKHLASVGGDATVRIWERGTGTEQLKIPFQTKVFNTVAFAPDGQSVVTADGEGRVIRWDARDGRELRRYRDDTSPCYVAAVSPDGRSVVAAGTDGVIRMWETATGKELPAFRGHTDSVVSLDFVGTAQLVSGSYDGTVRLWPLRRE